MADNDKLEPRGCPTPGACSCISALTEALASLKEARTQIEEGTATIEDATTRIAELEADRERLDWLATDNEWVKLLCFGKEESWIEDPGATLREAIDKAREESE